jgi:hypothetical protein
MDGFGTQFMRYFKWLRHIRHPILAPSVNKMG